MSTSLFGYYTCCSVVYITLYKTLVPSPTKTWKTNLEFNFPDAPARSYIMTSAGNCD